jgi:hypothetical protein
MLTSEFALTSSLLELAYIRETKVASAPQELRMIAIPSEVSLAVAVAAPAPFACNMKALSPGERVHHTANTDRLKTAVVETQERENAVRLRLSDGRMDLTALADWVRLERRCCPFFTFSIEVEGNGGPTWLTLSGPRGIKEFIQLEIGVP